MRSPVNSWCPGRVSSGDDPATGREDGFRSGVRTPGFHSLLVPCVGSTARRAASRVSSSSGWGKMTSPRTRNEPQRPMPG